MERENGCGVGNNGRTSGNGGASGTVWDCGTVEGNVDGGGGMKIEGGPGHREELPTKRKPLRGKRRGKGNISMEQEIRLANAMERWLGVAKPRPKN